MTGRLNVRGSGRCYRCASISGKWAVLSDIQMDFAGLDDVRLMPESLSFQAAGVLWLSQFEESLAGTDERIAI